MFTCQDLVDRGDKVVPGAALLRKHRTAAWSHTIIAAAALARLFRPAPSDQPFIFQAAKDGVQRAHAEGEAPSGTGLDQFADLVAVAGTRLQQRQDQEFSAAFFEFATKHNALQYTSIKYIVASP